LGLKAYLKPYFRAMKTRLNKSAEDDALLTLYWKGDNEVPDFWIWERHKQRLYAVGRGILRRKEEAIGDALRDTIMKLIKYPVTTRSQWFNAGRKARVLTCLSNMVVNVCKDVNKHEKRLKALEASYGADKESVVDEVFDKLAVADQLENFSAALKRLYGAEGLTLLRMYTEGYTRGEIAEALGITTNNCYQKIYQLKLRAKMLLLNQRSHAN